MALLVSPKPLGQQHMGHRQRGGAYGLEIGLIRRHEGASGGCCAGKFADPMQSHQFLVHPQGRAAGSEPQRRVRFAPNCAGNNPRCLQAQLLIIRIQQYKHFTAIFPKRLSNTMPVGAIYTKRRASPNLLENSWEFP